MPDKTPLKRKKASSALLFADFFSPDERAHLARLKKGPTSLAGEIDLLRIGMRRMTLFFNNTPETSIDEFNKYLSAIGLASIRVRSLLQTQLMFEALDDDLKDALNQSLRALAESWQQEAAKAAE